MRYPHRVFYFAIVEHQRNQASTYCLASDELCRLEDEDSRGSPHRSSEATMLQVRESKGEMRDGVRGAVKESIAGNTSCIITIRLHNLRSVLSIVLFAVDQAFVACV